MHGLEQPIDFSETLPCGRLARFCKGSPSIPTPPPPSPVRGQSAAQVSSNLSKQLAAKKGRRSTILTAGQEDVNPLKTILGG